MDTRRDPGNTEVKLPPPISLADLTPTALSKPKSKRWRNGAVGWISTPGSQRVLQDGLLRNGTGRLGQKLSGRVAAAVSEQ